MSRSVAHMLDEKKELVKDVHRLSWLRVQLKESSKGRIIACHNSESSLLVDVKSKECIDPLLIEFRELVLRKNNESYYQGEDGVLRYQGILCVADVDGLRENIMDEAHGSLYSIYPGSTKMYRDLFNIYWWNGIKREVATFMSRFGNFQQIKVEHKARLV